MTKKIYAVAIAAAVAAALLLPRLHAARQVEAPPPTATEPASISASSIHYPAGAPQLAYLKIEPVHLVAVPALEPMTARLTYDEDHTHRVTSPVNGRVVAILAAPGDRVSAGQPLARLDSPDYAQAVADHQKAQTDLRAKAAAFQRARLLLDGGVLARKDYEAAEADHAAAAAEAERAANRLRGLGPDAGGAYVLRSRIAGVIADRQLNPGQEIHNDGATNLFVVTDPSRLWLTMDLAERDLGKVHAGQQLRVELDAYPGESFTATVASVGVTLDAATRRLPVRAIIGNKDGRLHPEMFARAYPLDDGDHRLVMVPNSALVTIGLYSYLWVEKQPGTLERRKVKLALQHRDRSYVAEGLSDNERVVTTGALLLEADTAGG